jgi:hypothetical protein
MAPGGASTVKAILFAFAFLAVSAKIRLPGELSVSVACEKINRLEATLKLQFPEIGWCFVGPDISD